MTKQLPNSYQTVTHLLVVKAIVNDIYFTFTENSNLNVSQCQRWNTVCVQLIYRIPLFSCLECCWKGTFLKNSVYICICIRDWGYHQLKVMFCIHGKQKYNAYSAFPHTLWVKIPVCYKSSLSILNDSMGEQVLVCKCHGALSWWKENSDWSVSTSALRYSVFDLLHLI